MEKKHPHSPSFPEAKTGAFNPPESSSIAPDQASLPLLTRREVIKKTLFFSTGILAASWFGRLQAQTPPAEFSDKGIHFLAFGDFGTSGNENQRAVGTQMERFARTLPKPLTAVLALGDNFYQKLEPERFTLHFEDFYSKEALPCPFYAVLGNHDYGPQYDSKQGRPKAQMELDYAKEHPESRFKMPNRWYAQEFPEKDPLVKIIFLDGNFWEGALTPAEKLEQKRFLSAELEKGTKAPWLWVVSHFPIFSQTNANGRGDNERLVKEWSELFHSHGVSLYISGHDHNLQHLTVEGLDTHFVISGAGGASLHNITPSERGFARTILGFNHLYVTHDFFEMQIIDSDGNQLHHFRQTAKKQAV